MLYNSINLSVAKIASKDKTRPELCSVYFTKNKVAASDSYRLVEITTPEDAKPADYPEIEGVKVMQSCEPFMVSAEAIGKIKLPKNKNLPILENLAIKSMDDKKVDFIATDLEKTNVLSMQKTEGKFPDYLPLFPMQKPIGEVLVNGEYLKSLIDVLSKLGGACNEVRIKFYGKDSAIVIEAGKLNQRGRALLSPIKEQVGL